MVLGKFWRESLEGNYRRQKRKRDDGPWLGHRFLYSSEREEPQSRLGVAFQENPSSVNILLPIILPF
jgi:hypothetical protein